MTDPTVEGISQIYLIGPGDRRIEDVRELFLEYADWLDADLSFQDFDGELEHLPGDYAEPHGALFLAMRGTHPAGCVGVRLLEEGTCEMKRLWVRPKFRGQALGARLAGAALDAGIRLGYHRMRLDTLEWMKDAIRLYHSLGFRRISAYYDNPLPSVVYLETILIH